MGLSNRLSCEAGSFSCHLNPHRCFQSEVLRLHFPALGPWVACLSRSPVVPPCLSAQDCGTATPPAATLPRVLSTWQPSPPFLPVQVNVSSLSPWLLDFHSVFWQFWLFFVFKLVVVLLLVVPGGSVCVPTPPPCLEVLLSCISEL